MDVVIKLSTILGLVMVLIALGTLIFRIGKSDENTNSRLTNIERSLKSLDAHISDDSIHINPSLETYIRKEQETWRNGVDRKLDLLLVNKPTQ